MSALMKHRRGTSSEWNFANPVLAEGELGVEEDTGIIKIGDGASTWAELQPAFSSHYLPRLGKAYDSDRLDGLDSGAFAKTEDVAGFATTTDLTNQRTALDSFILPAGSDRKLIYHFGQVTEYPTEGVKVGDRCHRTDLFCEMYYNGSWRQSAIARLTSTQRKAIITGVGSALYGGFEAYETDTNRSWLYTGAAWQYLGGGVTPRVRLVGANVVNLPQADGPWNSWAAPEYDADGFWDAANMQLKVPAGFAGEYQMDISWIIGGSVASTTLFVFRAIKKARTAQTSPPTSQVFHAAAVTLESSAMSSGPIRLNENDIISFQYYTNQASLAGGGSQFGQPSTVTLTYVSRHS